MCRDTLVYDQGKGCRGWWETHNGLLKPIDMSLEKIGQPVLVDSVFLDLRIDNVYYIESNENPFGWFKDGLC